MTNTVVMGGGPNGLAAATALAREGVQVTFLETHEEVGGRPPGRFCGASLFAGRPWANTSV